MKIGDTIRCNDYTDMVNVSADLMRTGYFAKKSDENVLTITMTPMRNNITRLLEDTREVICDNFCKYRDTSDDSCECEWTRNFGECPLNIL